MVDIMSIPNSKKHLVPDKCLSLRTLSAFAFLILGLCLAVPFELSARGWNSTGMHNRTTVLSVDLSRYHDTVRKLNLSSSTLASKTITANGFNSISETKPGKQKKNYALIGAIVGFAGGFTATYLVLNTGNPSLRRCDQSSNQDAFGSKECLGLYLLGGFGFAVVGGIIGALIHRKPKRRFSRGSKVLRVSLAPQPGSRFGLAITGAF